MPDNRAETHPDLATDEDRGTATAADHPPLSADENDDLPSKTRSTTTELAATTVIVGTTLDTDSHTPGQDQQPHAHSEPEPALGAVKDEL